MTAWLVVSLTVDGPIEGVAAVSVWVLPTLIGTALIRAWHQRLDPARAGGLRVHWGRIRLPVVACCLAAALVVWLLGVLPGWFGVIAILGAMALYTRVGAPPARSPIRLVSPVSGRWRAVNGPADSVPSHGVHAYGQSFAVDLVHEPRDQHRPPMRWWPPARRPERYPGDHGTVLFADGIPFTFADVAAGVPSRREPFVA